MPIVEESRYSMRTGFWFVALLNVYLSRQESVIEEERKKSEKHVRENLSKICELDKAEQMKTVLSSITVMIQMTLPNWVGYDDMDVVGDTLYVCAVNGKLENMNSLGRVNNGIESMENSDGSLHLHFSYNLLGGGVSIKYSNYYQHYFMNILGDIGGNLVVGFLKGAVEVIADADPPAEFVDKLNADKCVVRVTSVKVTLSSPYSSAGNVGGIASRLTKAKLRLVLEGHMKSRVHLIEERVRQVFYQSFAKSGSWICLERFGQEGGKTKVGESRSTPTSANFKRYCGKFIKSSD